MEISRLYELIHDFFDNFLLLLRSQVAEKLALELYEEFDVKRRKAERLIADDEDKAILEGLQAIAKSAEALSKK